MTAIILVLIVAQSSAITLDAELAELDFRYDPYTQAEDATSATLVNTQMAPAVVGEELGITTYDFQQNGAMGNRIAVDSSGNVHISWMRSIEDPPFATRDVYYNYWQAGATAPTWVDGVEASSIPRAGYTTCGFLPSGAAVVAFHHDPDGDGVYESAVSIDAAAGAGAFSAPVPVDNVTVDNQPIWPHMTVGADGVIHILARVYWDGNGEQPENLFHLYYSRSTDDGETFSNWEVTAADCISDAAIATSVDGDKVAVAWTAGVPVEAPSSDIALFGHIKYIESTNSGQSWGSETNVTRNRYPSGLGYIDEVPDEEQAYRMFANSGEVDCAYDNSGTIEILFCDGLHYYYNEGSYFNYAFYGRINHWNEANGFSIPSGPEPVVWTDNESTDSLALWGINQLTYEGHNGAYTPQIAVWDNNIIAVWGGQRDTLDQSTGFTVNGDIYASVSPDNGATWHPLFISGLPVDTTAYYSNITSTHSYGADPGNCDDEDYISIWPRVGPDSVLHITYIHDRFAGSVVGRAECPATGVATDNPVVYIGYGHKVSYYLGIEEDKPIGITPELITPNLSTAPVSVSMTAALAEPGEFTIRNVAGQTVYSLDAPAGTASITWDGCDSQGRAVPAGMYFLEVKTASTRGQGKVTLVR